MQCHPYQHSYQQHCTDLELVIFWSKNLVLKSYVKNKTKNFLKVCYGFWNTNSSESIRIRVWEKVLFTWLVFSSNYFFELLSNYVLSSTCSNSAHLMETASINGTSIFFSLMIIRIVLKGVHISFASFFFCLSSFRCSLYLHHLLFECVL